MRTTTCIFSLLVMFVFRVSAQPEISKRRVALPLIVTLQFHSIATPFQNLRSNFSNVGIGLGTEVSYNSRQTFTQQLHAIYYRNRPAGNGLLIYTQPCWRPGISKPVFAEVKAGVGYLYSFRPVKSYQQKNGTWIEVGHRGKGMLAVPIGVSLGYNSSFEKYNIAPFVSYQFLVVSGYNSSIPIVPETLLQIGSRFQLK